MYQFEIRQLSIDDCASIVELERVCWPLELQASQNIIYTRFSLGHNFAGILYENRLIGLGAYVYTDQDPYDKDAFPDTFNEFASIQMRKPNVSMYVYNLSMHPDWRGTNAVLDLLEYMKQEGRCNDCKYAVGDGRCQAYNGSQEAHDNVKVNPKFKKAIDDWYMTGNKPTDEILLLDPLLKFHRRNLDCEFLYLKKDFLPGDVASGGFRVIFVHKFM